MPPKKKIQLAPPSIRTKHKNYIIHIEIRNIQNPRVTRTLSVPPSITFYDLHEAIQFAFGWGFSHPHQFEVNNIPGIWLQKTDPPPCSTSPRVLLTIGNPPYEEADGIVADEATTKLSDVFENEKYKNKYIEYTYDFGDSWEHSVLLFGRAEEAVSSDFIFCIGGEGAPVAEDVGGPPGWEHLKDVVKRYQRKGKLDTDDKHLIQWFKNQRNGGVEVWDWNLQDVNRKLSTMRL